MPKDTDEERRHRSGIVIIIIPYARPCFIDVHLMFLKIGFRRATSITTVQPTVSFLKFLSERRNIDTV